MALDNKTILRKRIGDDKKLETESFRLNDTGSGTLQLRYTHVTVMNIYDKAYSSTALSPSDYEYDSATGVINLLYAQNMETTVTVVYSYYAFSDAELDELLATTGSLEAAAVEAVRWLIADAARLHDYSRGATSESLNQIYKNLKDMLANYETVLSEKQGTDGSKTNLSVDKRIHNYYRGTRDIPFDLSRDDSLSK